MNAAAIELRDLHKVYRRYGRRKNFGTLKSALLGGRVLSDLKPDATFEALKGISLTVQAGRSVGVVGRNGSGKSTLLKLLAGIGRPTAGTLSVAGRVSALIELGAGFHPEISGRENVFINGMMMGLSKQEMTARFDDIVAFAEIGDFIDAPVKTYSSGMYMRLGFSVAIHVDPDVLLVDEVLAVGDEAFTHKCLDRFAELKLRKKTIVLVTHTLDLVTRLCDEAVWLDAGVIRAQGDPKRVVDAYLLDVAARENQAGAAASVPVVESAAPQDMNTAGKGRWGSREAEITSVAIRRRRRHGRARLPVRRGDGHRPDSPRPAPAAGFRVRRRDLHCRRRLLLRDQHTDRGRGTRRAGGNGGGGIQHRFARSRRGDVPSGCGRAPCGRRALRLPPAPAFVSRDVRRQGRRDCPPAAPLVVWRRRPHRRPAGGASAFMKSRAAAGDLASAQELVARTREAGGAVVFTNGVFDLVHPGHIRYLQAARRLGDALVVGVNSDRSVRAIKGPARPVNPEHERVEILCALGCVDAAVVFDEDTPLALITRIQPDVLVKGADWAADEIVGRDVVEARGGRVVRMPIEAGFSTTDLIGRASARP